jgi:hypothetical protein
LFSVPMVCAQSQPASDGSSGPSSVAAVPRLIKFSGAVRDARGEPLGNVAVRLTFSVYEEAAGGAALWIEPQVAQLDEQGHYTVLLGATRADGLPVELFPAGKARWLGVQVEGRDEDPRVLLVSVPYALKAEDAAMLGGRSAADFVLGEQLKEEVRTQVAAQTPGIATQAVEMLVSNPPNAPAVAQGPSTFTCISTGDCVAVTQISTGRALRTTATSTSEAVLVQQNGTGYGLRALSPGNIALLGQVTGSAGTSYGVKGQTTSTTGAGVFGYNLATTGLAYGILGQTASTSGTALFGRATSTTGATIGLRGHSDSTSGVGILGQATAASGVTTGLVARVFSVDGTALIVDNTKGGKLLSAQVNGAEKFSVSGSGSVNSSGTLTGTRLISTVATGTAPLQVSSTTLVPSLYASRASLADTATTAATAATALNALALGGVAVANYSRLDVGNSFSGNQNVTGNVSATGSVSGGSGSFAGSTSPGGSIVSVTQQGSTTTPPEFFFTPPPIALLGEASATTNFAIGVAGKAHSPQAFGVVGGNDATTGWATGVAGITRSTSGTGVNGTAEATTGPTFGVVGVTFSTSGRGVQGDANADSGSTVGVHGGVNSASGTAGVFHNRAGGDILLGRSNYVNKFRVDGNGNVETSGSVTATSFVGALSGTASDLDCTGCVSPPELDFDPATQAELDAEASTRATADTSEGTLRAAADATLQADIGSRVSKSGDTMAGTLNLPANGLAAGTNQLVLSGGNVGIGTASPANRLSVAGSADFSTGVQSPSLTALSGDGNSLAVRSNDSSVGNGGGILLRAGDNITGNAAYGAGSVTLTAGGFSPPLYPTIRPTGASLILGGAPGAVSYVGGDATLRGGNGYNNGQPVAGGSVILEAGSGGGSPSGLILFKIAGTEYARLSNNGNVGIGTATPANILTVVQSSATDPIADAWTTYSSRRWKTNIQTLQGALDKVERLRGVSYDAKADGQHNIGLIAEEVGEVVPEVVAYEANGKDAKSVDYARLTAVLIEAVKEQQAQIQTLKSEIERLSARLEGGVETASR